jgi:PIN domain nuclease of toxin-antitoxin system
MSRAVLDASAVLALLNDEPGSDVVARHVPQAAMSAVNFCEVAGKLGDKGLAEDEIRAALEPLGFEVHPFDTDLAYATAHLRIKTRSLGLSLGDRACLALGLRLHAPVITADGRWKSLKIGVRIRAIR